MINSDLNMLDKKDLEMMNLRLSNWRDFILSKELEKNEFFINSPIFDKKRPNEDDIFVFSGYIAPGQHKIQVYDPHYKCFFESKTIYVQNRTEEIKDDK